MNFKRNSKVKKAEICQKAENSHPWVYIFSRQASLGQQAFLITALHGARYKTGQNAYAKK